MDYTLKELADRLQGDLQGDGELLIRGVAGLKEAAAGEITFLGDPRFEPFLKNTGATAVILPVDHACRTLAAIRVKDPRAAFQQVMELFADRGRPIPPGVHPSAVVGPETTLGEGVAIGPQVVIGARCRIGSKATILPGAVIGNEVEIGAGCLIYPNAVLWKDTVLGERVTVHAGAVIGDDGFGFLSREGRHIKVPQLGRVVIEDDVEIGANTCIDRATTGTTRVARGTRIDNLVQIAHNVQLGEDAILCAQVGIAGSAVIGRQVTLAGQVGVVGHITIGDRVLVGAQGGVTKSVADDQQVSGYPATPHRLARRMYAALRNLPETVRELRRLRERVARLESKGEKRS